MSNSFIQNTAFFNIRTLGNNFNGNLLPDMVYVDSCSLIDMTTNRERGEATQRFIDTIQSNDGIITWSEFTINELTQFLHVGEYMDLAAEKSLNLRNRPDWKRAENTATNEEALRISVSVMEKVVQTEAVLKELGMALDIPGNLQSAAMSIYRKYGGNLADAQHVAVANHNGVNSILTADNGFHRYPTLNIFTANVNVDGIVSMKSNTSSLNDYINLLSSDELEE